MRSRFRFGMEAPDWVSGWKIRIEIVMVGHLRCLFVCENDF